MLLFTSVMVSVRGSPGAVVVEVPKLLRISLRTMPLAVSMLLVLPLAVFEPSEGYGPLVSAGSAMQEPVALDEELLEDELDDELLLLLLEDEEELLPEVLSEPPPPQAATKAAAPPEASHPSTCRRCRRLSIMSRSLCRSGCR